MKIDIALKITFEMVTDAQGNEKEALAGHWQLQVCLIEYNNFSDSKSKKIYCFLLRDFQNINVNKSKKVLEKRF